MAGWGDEDNESRSQKRKGGPGRLEGGEGDTKKIYLQFFFWGCTMSRNGVGGNGVEMRGIT